jgi:hypothetical protein
MQHSIVWKQGQLLIERETSALKKLSEVSASAESGVSQIRKNSPGRVPGGFDVYDAIGRLVAIRKSRTLDKSEAAKPRICSHQKNRSRSLTPALSKPDTPCNLIKCAGYKTPGMAKPLAEDAVATYDL